ncbi:Fungal Zn(2)-Cys(6) binuclear cluster domain [Ceratobasidium sp. AG-Ba]|nr:Fungal Zn(2)-Cys(6) binuclear cluster domain [Ceratobasidium sp. AG-Ba]
MGHPRPQEIKKSKITLLRDEITALRNRVYELETTGRATSTPPSYHVAYAASPTVSDNSNADLFRGSSPNTKPDPHYLQQQPVSIGGPAYGQYTPSPTGHGEGFQASLVYPNLSSGWREVAPSANGLVVLGPLDQPLTTAETLHNILHVDRFRLQCAFEIDIPNFESSLEDPDPNNRPHEALINAIALMACYYNQDLRWANRAQIFVDRTRQCLQSSLTGIRSRKVIQQIQAGHLLSCYLYWTGSLLEGHAALANAVSLGKSANFRLPAKPDIPIARLCNLHKITSLDWTVRGDNLLEEASPYRPILRPMPSILNHNPSRSAIEHGERIHCFWNLLLVDTGGSVSTGYPCQFTSSDSDPGTKIETMYPLPLHEYLSVAARAHTPQTSYSDIFQPHSIAAYDDTPLISRIKAALLLHRVARLGTAGKSGEADHEFQAQWENLRECLNAFVNTLRRLGGSGERRPPGMDMTDERRDFLYSFIAWSLVRCAQVVMYSITPLAWRRPMLQQEAFAAAEDIVDLITTTQPSEDELKMMDVMVGYSWMTAANFLINLRNMHERDPRGVWVQFSPVWADQQLDVLESATAVLSKTCRPVVRQAQGTRVFRERKAGPYEATPVQAPHTWNS